MYIHNQKHTYMYAHIKYTFIYLA